MINVLHELINVSAITRWVFFPNVWLIIFVIVEIYGSRKSLAAEISMLHFSLLVQRERKKEGWRRKFQTTVRIKENNEMHFAYIIKRVPLRNWGHCEPQLNFYFRYRFVLRWKKQMLQNTSTASEVLAWSAIFKHLQLKWSFWLNVRTHITEMCIEWS